MVKTAFSVILLLIGLVCMSGTLTWVIRKGNNNKMTRIFVLCQCSVVVWLISQFLILFSESTHQLWISYLIGNVGIAFFGPLWLMFSAEFSGIGARFKQLMYVLPVISVSAVLIVLSNPIHGLYYSMFEFGHIEYAVLFYVFQIIYYVCIILGITLLCFKQTQKSKQTTSQAALLTLSTAVPLAINTLTLTHVIDIGIELTPLFFAFSGLMIILALSRYGLLNINRIAINDTINNIKSGVLVFDNDGVMSFRNKYAEKFLEGQYNDYSSFCDALGKYTESDTYSKESADIHIGAEYYNVVFSDVYERSGNKVAKVVTINDITEFYDLAAAEKKLSLEQERNRIAQEMHDSAGHTFTMISSLARILKQRISDKNTDISETQEYISEIDGLSRSGVTQLRCTINNLREDSFMTSITGAVRTVLDALRNTETDLCIQGTEDERYSFCIREVYDSFRETVTNTVRYSDASRIDVILKFLDDRLELYILDNGRGCGEIHENNGLRGIRERTEKLGGTVRFSSVEGEGFSTVIKIPVNKGVKI